MSWKALFTIVIIIVITCSLCAAGGTTTRCGLQNCWYSSATPAPQVVRLRQLLSDGLWRSALLWKTRNMLKTSFWCSWNGKKRKAETHQPIWLNSVAFWVRAVCSLTPSSQITDGLAVPCEQLIKCVHACVISSTVSRCLQACSQLSFPKTSHTCSLYVRHLCQKSMTVASKSCIWLAGGLFNKLLETVQTL